MRRRPRTNQRQTLQQRNHSTLYWQTSRARVDIISRGRRKKTITDKVTETQYRLIPIADPIIGATLVTLPCPKTAINLLKFAHISAHSPYYPSVPQTSTDRGKICNLYSFTACGNLPFPSSSSIFMFHMPLCTFSTKTVRM